MYNWSMGIQWVSLCKLKSKKNKHIFQKILELQGAEKQNVNKQKISENRGRLDKNKSIGCHRK